MVLYYANLAREYHWTQEQIDNTDLEFLVEMLLVETKVTDSIQNPGKTYIDNLL